jgi:hypothetical protein
MTIRSVSFSLFAIASLGLVAFGGCGGSDTYAIQNIPAMTPEELAAEEVTSEAAE